MDLLCRLEGHKGLPSYEIDNIVISSHRFDSGKNAHVVNDPDADIVENKSFAYLTVRAKDRRESAGKKPIMILHGLNEKCWSKYLPWAAAITAKSGRPVILFPIAFHMDRAPKSWSDPRAMFVKSKRRKELFPGLKNSSFANASLSQRLQELPERFLAAGLQSFLDIADFALALRNGELPYFQENSTLDILAYSIGAILGKVLLMAGPEDLFDESRLFMFCGGALLADSYPVTKAILDEAGFVSLISFLGRTGKGPASGGGTLEAEAVKCFRCLISSGENTGLREKKLSLLAERMFYFTLTGDKVIPPAAIDGLYASHDGRIEYYHLTKDFPFAYSHEAPFPLAQSRNIEISAVEDSFNSFIDMVLDFF